MTNLNVVSFEDERKSVYLIGQREDKKWMPMTADLCWWPDAEVFSSPEEYVAFMALEYKLNFTDFTYELIARV